MTKEQENFEQEPYLFEIHPSMQLSKLHEELSIAKSKGKLAFVLGNGINKYAHGKDAISWEELLKGLWNTKLDPKDFPNSKYGLSLTEVFDIMCMKTKGSWDESIKSYRKDIIDTFKSVPLNDKLQKQLEALGVPVLTTNYDSSIEGKLHKHTVRASSVYPLEEYFSNSEITKDNYGHAFSVWHIHGRHNHQKSIRLGTADYMGLLTYTRNYLQKGANLFNVKKEGDPWGIIKYGTESQEANYRFSWLEIFYNCSLCINGLGLNSDETYLRWLLISRKKYLDRIGSKQTGWYICSSSDLDDGKKFFLKNVGFNIVIINDLVMRYKKLFEF